MYITSISMKGIKNKQRAGQEYKYMHIYIHNIYIYHRSV